MTAPTVLKPWDSYRNLTRRVLVDGVFLIVFGALMFDPLFNPAAGSFGETVGSTYVVATILFAGMKIVRAVQALGASTHPKAIAISVLVAGFYAANAWLVHYLWAGKW